MSARTNAQAPDDTEPDMIEAVLNAYDGDAIAALRGVIADAAFLHNELRIASAFLSYGAARGWRPRFVRE